MSTSSPVTKYSLFYNGENVANERMNDKKFLKLVKENKLFGL